MGAIEGGFLEASELVGGGLATYSPLESLFSEHDARKKQIEDIAQFAKANSGAMSYFFDGASTELEISSFEAQRFFDADHALRSLAANFWTRAMALTDCLELMPARRRQEWRNLIAKRVVERVDENGVRVMDDKGNPIYDEIPPFTRETVLPTIENMMSSRQKFLGERVDGLFFKLSGDHVTNSPSGFRARMIVANVLDSHGYRNHSVSDHIHDLRCVIAMLMNRDTPYERATDYSLGALVDNRQFGEWFAFDGGALRIKLFMKGTAHLEVHPDIAYRLNQILAWMHPSAIPSDVRKKPTKPFKEFALHNHALPFKALKEIEAMRRSYGTRRDPQNTTLATESGDLCPEAEQVMLFLGGVKDRIGHWKFEYPILPVIEEVIRTGVIPEQKSHQYYATQEALADDVVEQADIQEGQRILEPSAGQGGLADRLPKDQVTCVEISTLQAKVLEAKGFKTHCADFLRWSSPQRFDRIVMNPPFANGRAVDHVRHAASMLADNGRLVAILPASLKGKEIVSGYCHEWSIVRQNEFIGTGVSVVILVLFKKPE